ncbi:hypothetical protein F993_01680 [Acinetobacter proteolyticus]|uniref:Uncharacterized protein n=1 Tax=Acinetobacter proteolyticus TaxID=1776741 RepID=A0ABN0JEF8_9GAMM|nr:hypothetical protein [Acinetobacter proteolyticus]ENU23527.1 hypothetical protein F993_01680 [Acinetobacter proteolyticus]
MSDINQVKNHIKNLINGHNISKGEMRSLYNEVLKEFIEKKVNKLFDSYSIHKTIETTVKLILKDYVNTQLRGVFRHEAFNHPAPEIERMVRAEIERQVKEVVSQSVSIQIKAGG